MHVYQALAQRVDDWRAQGYPHDKYPAIGEILEWASDPEGDGFRLRAAQAKALETYWYLRLCAGTPHILDLYRSLFSKPTDLLASLGLSHPDILNAALNEGLDALFQRIRSNGDFVRYYRLQALRETLTLPYPSYILALAMGTGKTIVIGTVFASEFAMAMEYPDGPFVQNALVFAPGKTIIESLRELAGARYDRILPPRLFKRFAASVKLVFTRDGEQEIPVQAGSIFNVVVTNTEKIRIQKESIRKSDLGRLLIREKEDEARAEIANLRLQRIASLPHLAVFSDEAHHTYGQSLDTELKKVRKTVHYLAEKTNVVCVVNTTGTPYFQRQPLRDVVVWYGLSQGIHDGILKEVSGSIQAFDFEGDVAAYLTHVVSDFFRDYGSVALPDGTPAKLAIYFPQTDDVTALRPAIETRMAELGLPPTLILEHHTACENKADFDRLRSRDSPHRVALLVDRGVEGWDVPALFACALARRLRSSNSFVLQAASRCLRQVPGNRAKARIYLSLDNRSILDRQLQETYGESIAELNHAQTHMRKQRICLRKLDIAPLTVRQTIRRVEPADARPRPLRLTVPRVAAQPAMTKIVFELGQQAASRSVLKQVRDGVELYGAPEMTDLYAASVELSGVYHLDMWEVYDELGRLYGRDARELPSVHVPALARQIEDQTRGYQVREETVEVALALVKCDGFQWDDKDQVYTADIHYPLDREYLLLSWQTLATQNPREFGFHYTPYNFDSNPEKSFFELMLDHLNLQPEQIEDIYFTGALTTPDKTDFLVDYLGEDGRWHHYTPDFIVRRKDGRCLIVEIKNAQFRTDVEEDLGREEHGEAAVHPEGRKAIALKRWETLNSDRIKYELIFAQADALGYEQTRAAREFAARRGL